MVYLLLLLLLLLLMVPLLLTVVADTTATNKNDINNAAMAPARILADNNTTMNGTFTPPLVDDTASIVTNTTSSSHMGDFGNHETGDTTAPVADPSSTCDTSKYHVSPGGSCRVCPGYCPKECDESSDDYRVFDASDCDGMATSGTGGGGGGQSGGTTSTPPSSILVCDTTVYHLNLEGNCVLCSTKCPRECDPSSDSYAVYGSADCMYNDVLPLPTSMSTSTEDDDDGELTGTNPTTGQEQNDATSSATIYYGPIPATVSVAFMFLVVHRF